MDSTPTTPPRPFDVTTVFPQLAPLARTATRLHPRPGSPSPQDSSVGGPLLWPADEPWPHCDGPHAVAPCEGAMAMLPVAQLYARDVPDLPTPAGADLLQVLWCPFDHPIMPRTALFWRSAASVTDVLAAPPEPPATRFDGYLPEPCLLNPEQVTEYPDHLELSEELQERLGDWSVWEAAGTGVDSAYAGYPQEFYDGELSGAPGWKVGGWPRWGATDPIPRLCAACGSQMDALLTIATFEGDSDSSWLPVHADREQTGPDTQAMIDFFRARGIEVHERGRVPANIRAAATPSRQPTAVRIGSGYDQQLYVCPAAPEHPHSELMH